LKTNKSQPSANKQLAKTPSGPSIPTRSKIDAEFKAAGQEIKAEEARSPDTKSVSPISPKDSSQSDPKKSSIPNSD